MNRPCSLALLILLAGCKVTDRAAQSSRSSGDQGAMWERVQGTRGLALKLHARSAIRTASGSTTPVLYVGCGGLATALMVTAPGNEPVLEPKPATVQVALDGAAPVQQKWVEFADDAGRHWSPVPAKARLTFLMEMLDAKILQVDLSPGSASPRTATFDVQGFRAAFTRESTCASWRDLTKYK
jgi:hypothetical protein